MRLKHLEASLSSLQREFAEPKVQLEQYPTSPHLAACVMQLALDREDLGEGRSCLDLGCGTSMLLVAAALVDTDLCIGVDCDEEALDVAQANLERVEMEDAVELIQAQVRMRCIKGGPSTNAASRIQKKKPSCLARKSSFFFCEG